MDKRMSLFIFERGNRNGQDRGWGKGVRSPSSVSVLLTLCGLTSSDLGPPLRMVSLSVSCLTCSSKEMMYAKIFLELQRDYNYFLKYSLRVDTVFL